MPVKTKATSEEKIIIAKLFDSGRLSQKQAAKQMGVSKTTIQSWLARYQEQGAVSFALTERNQSYSPCPNCLCRKRSSHFMLLPI